jgi:6-phosphogluconolactonase
MHFFWGDERLVPPDDAGSNYYHAAQLLLDQVHVPTENIHRVQGELSAEAAVLDYTERLQSFATDRRNWPRFDLVLLGMGSDGHTASLFPGSPLKDRPGMAVKAVTADYEDRPSQRLTLTSAVFNDARHVLFLVTGANKADALSAVLDGPSDPGQWPAQRIQPCAGSITWLIDQAAATKLRRKP